MTSQNPEHSNDTDLDPVGRRAVSRRDFLKMAGAAGAAVGLAGGLGGLVAACGGEEETTTTAAGATTTTAAGATTTVAASAELGENWRIGMVTDLSGGMATLGADTRDGALSKMEVDNAAGGIKGPDGKMHKWEVLVQDGGTDTGKATAAFNQLIQNDKVDALIGPLYGSSAPAVQALCERAEIVSLMTTVPQPVSMNKGYRWTYYLSTSVEGTARLGVLLIKHLGAKSVAMATNNQSYYMGWVDQMRAMVEGSDIRIEKIPDTFTNGDANLNPQAQKLKGLADKMSADLIGICSDGISALPLLKAYRKLGGKLPNLGSPSYSTEAYMKSGGEDTKDTYFFSPGYCAVDLLPDSYPAEARQVELECAAAYMNYAGRVLSGFGSIGWQAFQLYAAAMGAVGTDKAKVRDYLDTVKGLVTPNGTMDFTKTHNGPTDENYVLYWVDENLKFKPLGYVDGSDSYTAF